MSMIEAAIAEIARKSQLRAKKETGDYYGDDGLLCCGKCHMPKQCMVDLLGTKTTVGVMCLCERAKFEAEQERSRKMSDCLESLARYENWHIRVSVDPAAVHPKMQTYLDNWEDMYKSGTGMLLWGDVGTGKSTSAAWLVKELRKRYVPALMTNFSMLGNVGDDLPTFRGIDLLVLDDLGQERQTDFMMERMFGVIDERSREGKPTVYTTNLTMSQMEHPETMFDAREARKIKAYKRVFSRVLERSIPICFAGPDHRADHKRETVERARKLFS